MISAGGYGVYVYQADNCVFRANTMRDAATYGIYVADTAEYNSIVNNVISNCVESIYLADGNVDYHTIVSNRIVDGTRGIFDSGGDYHTIEDNVICGHINNGIFLSGTIDSCTGGVWSMAGHLVFIRNSILQEVSYRGGGSIYVHNSRIVNMWGADRGHGFNITIENSNIGTVYDGRNGNGTIILRNSSISSKPTVRPEIIK